MGIAQTYLRAAITTALLAGLLFALGFFGYFAWWLLEAGWNAAG
jgi:hypothetical protein